MLYEHKSHMVHICLISPKEYSIITPTLWYWTFKELHRPLLSIKSQWMKLQNLYIVCITLFTIVFWIVYQIKKKPAGKWQHFHPYPVVIFWLFERTYCRQNLLHTIIWYLYLYLFVTDRTLAVIGNQPFRRLWPTKHQYLSSGKI